MKKVIVAMSGGVDSSVAAALLQEQGYDVQGMFMKNWSPETMQSLSDCPWEQDQADAQAVCEHLEIPFRSINFEREYKERVVDYFLGEYAAGRTPNPDVMCNKEIKFAAFLRAAEEMGAECIATGHYAQVREEDGRYILSRGVDTTKDQSYFLYTLDQHQLSKSLFPLGGFTKKEVRALAEKFKLPTAQKKDSQGICFIGHIDLKEFLREHITAKTGPVYMLPPFTEGVSFDERLAAAKLVGHHQGVMYYTIGERAGSVVDNGLYKRAWGAGDVPHLYILEKNIEKNNLYVTADNNDPHFWVGGVELESWNGGEESGELLAQVRYQQKDMAHITGRHDLEVSLTNCKVVALGQSLVAYKENGDLVGGGIIAKINRLKV